MYAVASPKRTLVPQTTYFVLARSMASQRDRNWSTFVQFSPKPSFFTNLT
jgi:hypothetical protein